MGAVTVVVVVTVVTCVVVLVVVAVEVEVEVKVVEDVNVVSSVKVVDSVNETVFFLVTVIGGPGRYLVCVLTMVLGGGGGWCFHEVFTTVLVFVPYFVLYFVLNRVDVLIWLMW